MLEVGCGIGTFTRFLSNCSYVLATDNNVQYLRSLRRVYAHFDNIRFRSIDWEHPDLRHLRAQRFDTILCLNVLEHIANDEDAVATFASLLEPSCGRLVLQVPALHWLYGEIDHAIGHWRRYDRDQLTAQLTDHDFTIEQARYFNVPGILGWYVNSVLLGRRTVPGVQARLANLLVPWLHLETKLHFPFGMSIIAVGRKGVHSALSTH